MVHPLVFAFLAPIGWVTASIIDKYILVHKIKRVQSYTAVGGCVGILIGLILALFLDWSAVSLGDLVYPVISGALMGIFIYFYIFILEKEDLSHLTGFNYIYPAVVALLSFLVLGEVIPLAGYVGMALTITGVLMLSWRLSAIRLRTHWWMIALGIVFLSAWAMTAKVAVSHMPEMNAAAASSIVEGITLLFILVLREARTGFVSELRNTPWMFASEVFNVAGFVFGFLAFAALPATIVAGIAGLQPLLVLLFERTVDALGGRISRDNLLLPKLVPIVLITGGVILLAIAGYG